MSTRSGVMPSSSFVSLRAVAVGELSHCSARPPGKLCVCEREVAHFLTLCIHFDMRYATGECDYLTWLLCLDRNLDLASKSTEGSPSTVTRGTKTADTRDPGFGHSISCLSLRTSLSLRLFSLL